MLHPSFKLEYFRKADWPDTWVQEALDITRAAWERRYKPVGGAAPPQSTVDTPIFLSFHSLGLHYHFLDIDT